jgi:tetratricopeptide (TPR) repeat protein
MAAKKKITRKEIKEPDEFITLWSRVLAFAVARKREALYGLAGFLVLVLLLSGWRTYSRNQEARASVLLGEAQEALASKGGTDPSGPALDRAVSALENLLATYPRTRCAQTGRLVLADLKYRQGDYEKAIEIYRSYLDRGHRTNELTALAWEGIAYCQEAQGKYEEAIASYRKAAETQPSYHPGWALLGVGRCLEATGKLQEATEVYRKFLADYPQHPRAREVETLLARIPKAEGPAGAPSSAEPAGEVKSNPEGADGPVPSAPQEKSK